VRFEVNVILKQTYYNKTDACSVTVFFQCCMRVWSTCQTVNRPPTCWRYS